MPNFEISDIIHVASSGALKRRIEEAFNYVGAYVNVNWYYVVMVIRSGGSITYQMLWKLEDFKRDLISRLVSYKIWLGLIWFSEYIDIYFERSIT